MAYFPMISPLSDSELDAVTGGCVGRWNDGGRSQGGIIQISIGGNSIAIGGAGGSGGTTGGDGGAATSSAGGVAGSNSITFALTV